MSGACSYRGCAKPDALGVYTRRPSWRSPDGRDVWAKDAEQPAELHFDALAHRAVDGSSNSTGATIDVFLYYLLSHSLWAIGPQQRLTEDNYARSVVSAAACPTNTLQPWTYWWSGGVGPLERVSTYSTSAAPLRRTPRGWISNARYPLTVSCYVHPPPPPPLPPPPPDSPPPPPPGPPPPVRLVPGPYSGRLEIFHSGLLPPEDDTAAPQGGDVFGSGGAPGTDGVMRPAAPVRRPVSQWGTVCDDHFDAFAAAVACRHLGLGRPLQIWTRASADEAIDEAGKAAPIWMENLRCGGEELSLDACGFGGWGRTDCLHSEDIYLLCAVPKAPPPPPPAVRSGGPLSPAAAGVLGGSVGASVLFLVAGLIWVCCRGGRLRRSSRPHRLQDEDGWASDDGSWAGGRGPSGNGRRGDRAVHITLHADGSASEAQQALAAALTEALQAEAGAGGREPAGVQADSERGAGSCGR